MSDGALEEWLAGKEAELPPLLGAGEFTANMMAGKLGIGIKRALMIIEADVRAGKLEPVQRRARNGNTVQAWRVMAKRRK